MEPIISENFADNGEHSHWSIVDAVTGKIIIEDIGRYNVEKKCILCNEWFVPKKSYCDTCDECLKVLQEKKAIKKIEKWLPGKREWDFIRENNNIMSPGEMADYFNITLGELTREKGEMGLTIDEEGSTREYELHRFLNRFERAKTWEFKSEEYSVHDFLSAKIKYDRQVILGRTFTQRGELS